MDIDLTDEKLLETEQVNVTIKYECDHRMKKKRNGWMTEINQREFGKTKLAIVSFFSMDNERGWKKRIKNGTILRKKNLENQFLKKELT